MRPLLLAALALLAGCAHSGQGGQLILFTIPVADAHAQASADPWASDVKAQRELGLSPDAVARREGTVASPSATPSPTHDSSASSSSAASDAEARREGSVDDPSDSCLAALATRPQFARLRKKLPLGSVGPIPFSMMTNDALPTPLEHKLIGQWAEARDACQSAGQDFREASYPTGIAALVGDYASQMRLIILRLYKGKLSYGSANEQIAAASDAYSTRLNAVRKENAAAAERERDAEERAAQDRELAHQRQLEQQRELAEERAAQEYQREIASEQASEQQAEAQRARRAAVLMQALQGIQPISPPPPIVRPPIITNCQQMGTFTNCMTQ